MALPSPASHLLVTPDKDSGALEVEVFRCETDGAVVFRSKEYDSSPLFLLHAGHKLRQPVVLKQDEIEDIVREVFPYVY